MSIHTLKRDKTPETLFNRSVTHVLVHPENPPQKKAWIRVLPAVAIALAGLGIS